MSLARLLANRTGLMGELEAAGRAISRRKWLLGVSALGALWETSSRAGPPASETQWLVDRLTMGRTPGELQLAETLGYEGYLQYHLDYESIDDSPLEAMLVPYTTLTMTASQIATNPPPAAQMSNELTEALILRSVFSKRQLFQRMVEFWTDHFNIDVNVGNCRYLKTVDDRDVIRAHAMGTFPALLSASAHSPAMLVYLDNNVSTAGNPNENYGRELLELHTLGVDGGYTQQDVQEVARCLTGWGLYPQNYAQNPSLRWNFRYNSGQHDNGQKVVLGHVIPAGYGINDGEGINPPGVLKILTDHPSTAQFISNKLCKWFYGESPPQALVDAVAATYANTSGDIRQMLTTLFMTARNMLPAPLKYKRPFHLFISALRACEATINSTSTLRSQHLAAAGQVPFTWGPPDGFPDTLANWVGLILPRWNFGAALWQGNLSNGGINGLVISVTNFLGDAGTPQAVMDVIDGKLFGGTMPADQKALIQQYMSNSPTTQQKREAVGLAIDSPAFQWY